MDQIPTDILDLSSTTAIIAATIAILQVLKPSLAKIIWLQHVPIWALAVIVACGLAWLARDVMHSLDGSLPVLMWKAAIGAAGASGAYEWFRAPGKSPASTKKRPP